MAVESHSLVHQQSNRPQKKVFTPLMVVLGGNAFAEHGRPLTMKGQFDFAALVSQKIISLLTDERPLLVTHGNGPQVGHMLARVEAAADGAYRIPLEVCVAETEGELGYVLQQSLHNVMVDAGTPRSVVSLLTQVVVDEFDAAFKTPTKPIGPVLSEREVTDFESRGISIVEDARRGLRRAVPSPRPVEIVETEIIRRLLKAGIVVIAAGGGGVPVIRVNGRLRGVDAVVDKDLASALLGEHLGAMEMLTITDVPCAYLNFQTSSQSAISHLSVDDARQLIAAGHFAAGSMLPKIEAACQFCRRPGTRAVICSPDNVQAALAGQAGTVVRGPVPLTEV